MQGMRYTPRFTTGPFLSASCIIEDAALSFYFYYLLKETVEKQMQTEFDLATALAAGDKELIKECEARYIYFSVFSIASSQLHCSRRTSY